MGTDQWKKFKRSLSQLSLPARLATDLTNMNVRAGRHSEESESDISSLCVTDHELTPVYSSTSTVDMNANPIPEADPRPLSMISQRTTDTRRNRESCGSLPPRRHPYPANLATNYRNFQTVASPMGINLALLRFSPARRRTLIFSRKIASLSKMRGLKGLSTKLRRCFSFPGLRGRRKASSVIVPEEPLPNLELEETSREIIKKEETLYAKCMRVAQDLDLDESSVGSIIMILGEDTVLNVY
ncbi:hypothetical protein METSCH_D02810 [Metschnikowia aff. pulcherrima]|uniref:Uncharacterized protein n=1 Tax=Metschnikowia aff. pulcherrima TaxID=2163413 RepID=A0A4P6XSU4_9ASCO|nr:hypothetical protein METSCH_D02810 [Metschnikowia aff. pulcherrima]